MTKINDFLPFLSGTWVWSLFIEIISQLFYNCTNATGLRIKQPFLPFSYCTWVWTLKLGIISQLLYHCANTSDPLKILTFCHFHLVPLVARFEPKIFGSFVHCSTTVLMPVTQKLLNFLLFTHGTASGLIWTLELWIISSLFYRCANANDPKIIDLLSFSPGTTSN
jgi:hypothetical protein